MPSLLWILILTFGQWRGWIWLENWRKIWRLQMSSARYPHFHKSKALVSFSVLPLAALTLLLAVSVLFPEWKTKFDFIYEWGFKRSYCTHSFQEETSSSGRLLFLFHTSTLHGSFLLSVCFENFHALLFPAGTPIYVQIYSVISPMSEWLILIGNFLHGSTFVHTYLLCNVAWSSRALLSDYFNICEYFFFLSFLFTSLDTM